MIHVPTVESDRLAHPCNFHPYMKTTLENRSSDLIMQADASRPRQFFIDVRAFPRLNLY